MADHKLLLIPGPTEFHDDVLHAMATPGTSHVDQQFINTFGESIEMLRTVCLAGSKAQPFVICGSGTLGWDVVAANFLQAREKALVVNTGYFGDGYADCIQAYGGVAVHVRADNVGGRPSLQSIEQALTADIFKLVTVTHVDTSTGVLMSDIKEIVQLVRKVSPTTLVAVDAVCSLGAERLLMQEWDVDLVTSASQKALGCPPGLCVVICSARAMAQLDARTTPVASYFADLKRWLPIMRAYEASKPLYFATPAVQLIMALNASLKQLIHQGMSKRVAQHEQASAKVKSQLEAWGLKLVPDARKHAANTLTAAYYPAGVTAQQMLPLVTKRNVVIAGGLHSQIGSKYFRVGHMGISVTEPERQHVETILKVLKEVFQELGVKGVK